MTEYQKKSEFVTVLAWIFIIVSSVLFIYSVFQTIFMIFVFDNFNTTNETLIGNMIAISFFIILIFFGLLRTSISFLKRKNWARYLWVVILIFLCLGSILFTLFYGGFGYFLGVEEFTNSTEVPSEPEGTWMFQSIFIFYSCLALSFSLLTAWIIKKLLSNKVKLEFNNYNNSLTPNNRCNGPQGAAPLSPWP